MLKLNNHWELLFSTGRLYSFSQEADRQKVIQIVASSSPKNRKRTQKKRRTRKEEGENIAERNFLKFSPCFHQSSQFLGWVWLTRSRTMFYGSIVVIKRSGVDGSVFPVVNTECLFGRAEGCDIRVQLATVSKSHCRITINENYQVSFEKWISRNDIKHLSFPQCPIVNFILR